jgi:hypothetical protein
MKTISGLLLGAVIGWAASVPGSAAASATTR